MKHTVNWPSWEKCWSGECIAWCCKIDLHLLRTNMEDLREKTHEIHYQLYRSNRMTSMGFSDVSADNKPIRCAASLFYSTLYYSYCCFQLGRNIPTETQWALERDACKGGTYEGHVCTKGLIDALWLNNIVNFLFIVDRLKKRKQIWKLLNKFWSMTRIEHDKNMQKKNEY